MRTLVAGLRTAVVFRLPDIFFFDDMIVSPLFQQAPYPLWESHENCI
jgi:hypothetical protein